MSSRQAPKGTSTERRELSTGNVKWLRIHPNSMAHRKSANAAPARPRPRPAGPAVAMTAASVDSLAEADSLAAEVSDDEVSVSDSVSVSVEESVSVSVDEVRVRVGAAVLLRAPDDDGTTTGVLRLTEFESGAGCDVATSGCEVTGSG